MSVTLLQHMRDHLDAANLLDGYTVNFYRFSDQDLNGDGDVIVFRMTGTEGTGAHVIQRPDISIQMLCNPARVVDGDNRMLQILRYIRANFTATDIFNMWPIGVYTGPTYLQNNRARFELVVRCMTENY